MRTDKHEASYVVAVDSVTEYIPLVRRMVAAKCGGSCASDRDDMQQEAVFDLLRLRPEPDRIYTVIGSAMRRVHRQTHGRLIYQPGADRRDRDRETFIQLCDIDDALRLLPAREADVIRRRVRDGSTIDEIATETATPRRTVQRMLKRATATLTNLGYDDWSERITVAPRRRRSQSKQRPINPMKGSYE